MILVASIFGDKIFVDISWIFISDFLHVDMSEIPGIDQSHLKKFRTEIIWMHFEMRNAYFFNSYGTS